MDFQEVVQKIAAKLEPERIVLFGSRARGDFSVDSDFDVLVIMPNSSNPIDHFELAAEALYAARGKGFSMDVVVLTESEVQQSLEDQADFVFYAMQDGKVMYEKNRVAVA